MPDPDSPELILKRALAQYLHDEEAGIYRPTTPYLASERGILTSGPTLPTTIDNCIVLTSLQPIAEGRADMIWRIQAYTRVKGSNVAAGNAAAFVSSLIDQKEDVPPGLHIAWAWSFSRLEFAPDSNGRSAVAETFYFRGRRGH